MPYYNRDPKRDHNFDNRPYIYIYIYEKYGAYPHVPTFLLCLGSIYIYMYKGLELGFRVYVWGFGLGFRVRVSYIYIFIFMCICMKGCLRGFIGGL